MNESLNELREMSMDDLESKSFDRMFAEEANAGPFSKDQPTIVDPRTLKNVYVAEDWIYILVDRQAMKLAQLPWQVHKEVIVDGEMTLQPYLSHPYQRVLDNPNPLQAAYAFKYACVVDYCVTGNILIYKSQQKKWLVHVPAEIIGLDINGRGDLLGYDILGNDPQSYPVGQRTKLNPKDVIHVKRPNASSVYWGLSPLIPGQTATLFNRYSNEYLLNFYRKGAQPGMVLEMGEEANAEQAKKLLMTLETTYTGRRNQRRGMVLPKGVKASNISHTIADQQLIELIRNNREALINIYGVPKEELSIQETGGGIGSDQYKTALKNFWHGPLTSIAMMIESELTSRLKDELGKGYVIKLNMSSVPALAEDLLDKANTAQAMLRAGLTYNEVRAKVWKEKPYPGGDVLPDFKPMFSSPFDPAPSTVSNEEPSVEAIGAAAEDIKPLSIEDSLNYRAANIEALSLYSKSEDGKWMEAQQAKMEKEAKGGIINLSRLFLNILENQVVAAARIAKELLVDKAKADIPNRDELKKRIEDAFDRSKKDWVNGYTDVLAPQIDLGYDVVLETPFNRPYQDEIEALKAKNKKGRRETLKARSIDTFENVSKTTTERIMRAIDAGVASSDSLQDIARSIRDVASVSASRALTIARTEVLTATSIGQAAAMEDAATVIPNMVKVWVTAEDERVRESHRRLEGDIVGIDEKFSNGLKYPRDTAGEAGEVINCRCSWLAVSEDDLPALGLKR